MISINISMYIFFPQIQTQPETQSLEGHIPGGTRVNLGSSFPSHITGTSVSLQRIVGQTNLTKHFNEPEM